MGDENFGEAASPYVPSGAAFDSGNAVNSARRQTIVIHCYRSMNHICRHMEETYGFLQKPTFGPTKIAESLRTLAGFFDDNIKEKVEKPLRTIKRR
jgi:nitrogenase molybdenum-iron protein alpha/beta subunit